MNEEFISTKQALKIFELGFDEPCLKYCWNHRTFSQWSCKSAIENLFHRQKNFFENKKLFTISVPTYSQTFKWFNQKYKDLLLKNYGKIPHFTIIQNLIIDLNTVDLSYDLYDKHNSKNALIIAHGLFGSKQNWRSVAKRINEYTQQKVFFCY